MAKLLALVLCFFCTITYADNREWTNEEKNWGYGLLAMTLIDYQQTKYITKTNGLYELNPFLGHKPSMGSINTHFGLGAPIAYLIFDNADENRKFLLTGATAIEFLIVEHNIKKGIKVNFNFRM